MAKISPALLLAFKIWSRTVLITVAVIGVVLFELSGATHKVIPPLIVLPFAVTAATIPALLALWFLATRLKRNAFDYSRASRRFTAACSVISVVYSVPISLLALFAGSQAGVYVFLAINIGLFACTLIALLISRRSITTFFTPANKKQTDKMETTSPDAFVKPPTKRSDRILIKALITAGLIIALVIPMAFISNLVEEREARHEQISAEVSSKWAGAQTLSGPFIYLPYKTVSSGDDGKPVTTTHDLWILPENLFINATITPEERQRSIYKVLLYRSSVAASGNFEFHLPKDIDPSSIQFDAARICYRVSDYMGIENQVAVTLQGIKYDLAPGLPGSLDSTIGLSAPVPFSLADLATKPSFATKIAIRGSRLLHFLPLAANSEFNLSSTMASPSFDGAHIPNERVVKDNGFQAKWIFNKANLPFPTGLKSFVATTGIDFGVTIIEPSDQYAKTNRSVKYAVLFIGLTFGLFFIVEILQRSPVHPVQYILIGLALVIFYTLLLSIGEFLLFDIAYVIAAVATIGLITAYAYSHFRKISSALLFAAVLTLLYGFIFILIRLEDTALLVGSIGLFVVLAIVMFASRKVNWYGVNAEEASLT